MTIHLPATWKFGLIAIGAAAGAGALIAAGTTPAHATDMPACFESDIAVTESGTGTGVFTASIVAPASTECGVWLQTFSFDDGYLPVDPSDYGHPQTSTDWAWVVLTATPQTLTAVIPPCGPFQTDVSVGALQLNLPNGDLGADWVAGSVGVRPACAVVVTPTPTASPSPTPSATPDTVAAPADTAFAAAALPAARELASTGAELWLLIPVAALVGVGASLLAAARRTHQ